MIQFFVAGNAKTQGSLHSFYNHKAGKIVTPQSTKVKNWRSVISLRASEIMGGGELYKGPLKVRLNFYFVRPQAHYRTGKYKNILKDTAPLYPHGRVGDGDKLERAVFDALTGVIWVDDCQVVEGNWSKHYSENPGVLISVEEIEIAIPEF